VRKDYPELVSIINKGINAVPPERRDAILQKWFNVQIEYQPRWQEILKWSALTGGGFSLLLGLTLYWNRRLKAEIEHRVLAESELVQQRSVLEGVLESTESAVFSVDRAFKYTSFNATHKQIMGALYAAEIKHGESLLSYQTDADAAIAKGNLERALAGEAFVIEAESGDNARVRTVFEISHNPVKSVAGDVIGVAVFARDISAQKRAERDLLAMQAQVIQQEKLATIGQLAAGVAHEINNPVGFIKSNLVSLEKYNRKIFDYLAKEKAAAERYLPKTEQAELANLWRSSKLDFICKDIIDLVRESTEGTERVRRIVQDLVSFSRSQGDELVPVDVNQCLESTLAIAWNEIKHQAELRSELQPVPDVMANSQKLSQVFLNLLVNASHAVAKGGVISLRTWQEGDSVCVSVADNGCGIPPEIRGKIFEPFFTTKEVGKGTGLGLAISHDLVVKFGGSISLESAVGVGTTFTVRLPVVQERADA
jgi:PAS domain S-box-containing protein